MNGSILPRDFFARDAETVARELVGSVLVRRAGSVRADVESAPADRSEPADRLQRVRIVETEAYVGAHDLACHAAKGRTRRTEVMFGPAGHLYVYLIYGMYHMLNIVTGPDGDPQAVLLRAADPLAEVSLATHGSGRLARAIGLDRRHNGLDLCVAARDEGSANGGLEPPGEAWLEAGEAPRQLVVTARIGVGYAGEWSQAPLRFYDPAAKNVSVRDRPLR